MTEQFPPSAEINLQEQSKMSVPTSSILLALVSAALTGMVVYLGYQNIQLSKQIATLESNSSDPSRINQPVDTMQDEMTEIVTNSDSTSLSELTTDTPAAVEESWVHKQYVSNGQLVWDVLQPEGTVANEAGLHESYLGLQTTYKGYNLMAELSSPTFSTTPYPKSIDEWITTFFSGSDISGMYEVPQPITDHLQILKKSDSQTIKMATVTQLVRGLKDTKNAPMLFIFSWREYAIGGNSFHTNLIMVKATDGDVIPTAVLEEFGKKFVDGIIW